MSESESAGMLTLEIDRKYLLAYHAVAPGGGVVFVLPDEITEKKNKSGGEKKKVVSSSRGWGDALQGTSRRPST